MTYAVAKLIVADWEKTYFTGRIKTNQVLRAEHILKNPNSCLPNVEEKKPFKTVTPRPPKEEREHTSKTFQGMYLRGSCNYYNSTSHIEITKQEFLELCKDEAFRELWAPKLNPDMF